MGKITFIFGAVRSGKSSFAIKFAEESGKGVAFIATCEGLDAEMKRRIALHKKARPSSWKTFEEPKNLKALIRKIGNKFQVIIIDCLTLLLSNLLLAKLKKDAIEKEVRLILSLLRRIRANSIIVSNEVGLGVVPENKLAREFRDIAGRANQLFAKEADEVFFMLAGIPLKIK